MIECTCIGDVIAKSLSVADQHSVRTKTPNVVFVIEREARLASIGFDVPVGGGGFSGDPHDPKDRGHELADGEFFLEDQTKGGIEVGQGLESNQFSAMAVAEGNPSTGIRKREGTNRLNPNMAPTLVVHEDEAAPIIAMQLER